jgi:GTPase SAR1 family protein
VQLEQVMEEEKLGPNGAMIFCMELVAENLDWLEQQLLPFSEQGYYVLFDCPGQVELYTHDGAVPMILKRLGQSHRLCVVNLVDSFHCTDATKFISLLLLSLRMMLHLEQSHVNILSKIDLFESYGPADFPLEFYTEVMDLK